MGRVDNYTAQKYLLINSPLLESIDDVFSQHIIITIYRPCPQLTTQIGLLQGIQLVPQHLSKSLIARCGLLWWLHARHQRHYRCSRLREYPAREYKVEPSSVVRTLKTLAVEPLTAVDRRVKV